MTFINIFSLFFFFFFFSEKIRFDVSSESSAGQRIHLKHEAFFSSKDKRKKLKYRLLQFLFGAFRVKSGTVHLFVTYLNLIVNLMVIIQLKRLYSGKC